MGLLGGDEVMRADPVLGSLLCPHSFPLWSHLALFLKIYKLGPGDPVVKNPPCHSGDMGLTLGQGTKILHAVE